MRTAVVTVCSAALRWVACWRSSEMTPTVMVMAVVRPTVVAVAVAVVVAM